MAGKPKVAVVVDSAASLPADVLGQPQIYEVPMQLIWDGRTYLDGQDLAPGEFYRRLSTASSLPTTSGPSPDGFLQGFRRASAEAESVLCLTVSSRFSSSHDAACLALTRAERDLPGVPIVVVDTETAAGGEGLIAIEAWRAATRGADLEEAARRAREMIPRVTLYAFLDTLHYLWRGGRVPRLAYTGASFLRLKPLLEMARGEVRPIGRPRTRRKATERLLDLVRDRASGRRLHATVLHADVRDEAERLLARVRTEFDCADLFLSEFSPVMGAHIGPGLLGIASWVE